MSRGISSGLDDGSAEHGSADRGGYSVASRHLAPLREVADSRVNTSKGRPAEHGSSVAPHRAKHDTLHDETWPESYSGIPHANRLSAESFSRGMRCLSVREYRMPRREMSSLAPRRGMRGSASVRRNDRGGPFLNPALHPGFDFR